MVQITLDPRKNVEQNAETYFERAKKARRKSEGARAAIARLQNQLAELQKKQEKEVASATREAEATARAKARPKEWYERFRWFVSKDGFLCVGGRDATSNEIIIKKHTDPHDIVLHTDAPGSPFFVIKTNGKEVPQGTMQEAAEATALYSKAWKLGITNVEVYWVRPEQVSKQAPSGEYMPKGGFMITGRRNYRTVNAQQLAIGLWEDKIMGGPVTAVQAHCVNYALVKPGRDKTSDCAKRVRRKIEGALDDIIAVIPAGGCEVRS